jgi:hypothetical protein
MVEYKDLRKGMFLIDSLTFQTTWWAYVIEKVQLFGASMLRLSRENESRQLQIDRVVYTEESWNKTEPEHWTTMDKKDTRIVRRMMIEATFRDSDF